MAGRESAHAALARRKSWGELTGKTVLITGATSGIGHAIAEHMAESGARLILTGRNPTAGDALARRLGARFVAGDIADPAFPDRLVAVAVAAFGSLDILINNAGINHRGGVPGNQRRGLGACHGRERDGSHALFARGAQAHGERRPWQHRQYRLRLRGGCGPRRGRLPRLGRARYCSLAWRPLALDHGPEGIRHQRGLSRRCRGRRCCWWASNPRRGYCRRSRAQGRAFPCRQGGQTDRNIAKVRCLPGLGRRSAMSRAPPGWWTAATPPRNSVRQRLQSDPPSAQRALSDGCDACVARVTMDGHPGLARSRDSAAQCAPTS